MCIYNPQVQLTLELKDLTLIIIIDHNMVTVHNMAIGHNMGIITEPNMLFIGFEKDAWNLESWGMGVFNTYTYLHRFDVFG